MSDKRCRALLIEDNANDVILLKRSLGKCQTHFETIVCTDLKQGLSAVCDGTFDVVLSDLSLPDAQGLEAVRQLRLQAPDTPLIVLTGLASDESALASLDHGAQDYLVKDSATPEILDRSVRYAIQRQKGAQLRRLLEKLQASERLLERKNRRLSRLYKTAHRFVDNVSHEFRTPLTVVNEYVSLLRDGVVGPLNEDQKRMLDVIGDRAEDLNNMVDDMLDVSRLEAGMLGLWRRQCRVSEVVEHVRPSLVRKSNVKQVELQFDVPEDLPPVFCDDEKIGRVVINLTVNAIKFCGRPGVVQVWAKAEPERGQVLVGVTDNGEGIAPENLAVIFQRFRQVGADPRSSTKGFGLGLSIARELVHLNLGEIHVQSRAGAGTTFWFSVPIADPMEVMSRYVRRIAELDSGATAVSLLSAGCDEPLEASLAADVNTFLNTLVRKHDFVFRADDNQWLIAIPCEHTELDAFRQRMDESRESINRNRPGAPLPPITLRPLGTWLIPDSIAEFLEAVSQSVGPALVGR